MSHDVLTEIRGRPTAIDTGADLNNVTECGLYSVVNPVNGVGTGQYILRVLAGPVAGVSCTVQQLTGLADAVVSTRVSNGGTWTAWAAGGGAGVDITADADDFVFSDGADALTGTLGEFYWDQTAGRPVSVPGLVVGGTSAGVPPDAPASSEHSVVYTQIYGNVGAPAAMGSNGVPMPLAHHPAQKMMSLIYPNGGSMGMLGGTQNTQGTQAAGTLATTSKRTSMFRSQFSSAASTNSKAGNASNANHIHRGNSAGRGGFTVHMTFALATVNAAGNQGFFGVCNVSNDPLASDIATETDLFGIGFNDGDTNMSLVYNDGSGNAVVTGLGADFPYAADAIYYLRIHCEPNSSDMHYYVQNVESGVYTSGTISADLPTNTVFMRAHAGLTSGSSSAAVVLDIMNIYVEAPIMFYAS